MNHEDDMTQYDDDRLLAFALGLEDDPDLDAALAEDSALRERVEAMRADVGAVAAGLERVVPAPPDGYTDLGDPKWGELRQFVTAPASAAPRRRPTWLRVLAPAAAIALVLVAGVVGLQRLGDGGERLATTTEAGDKAAPSYDREGDALSGGTPGVPEYDVAGDRSLLPGSPDPTAYETVVVARAETSSPGRQRFEVLRVLRGDVGTYVTLGIVDDAATPGTLHVLYLQPTDRGSVGTPTPAPATVKTPAASAAWGAPIDFRYRRAAALAQQLPAGTDPDEVALP